MFLMGKAEVVRDTVIAGGLRSEILVIDLDFIEGSSGHMQTLGKQICMYTSHAAHHNKQIIMNITLITLSLIHI